MQQFRNLLKGWVGKVLLALFILPFLFVGIEGIFSSNSNQDVAITVNGTEISKVEVSRAVENQRQQLRQQMGDNANELFLRDEILRPNVENNLISRELIKQAAKANQMDVSPDLVKSYVRSMPQFQDENGQFSTDRLETLLVQANLSKTKLFEAIQEGMVIEQLQNAYDKSGFVTDQEFAYLIDISYQKRSLSHITLKVEDFKDQIELTDDEIKTYFQANKEQFRTPEEVKVNYVSVSAPKISESIEVPDDEVKAQYDAYLAEARTLERRRASHILVEVNDDRSEEEAMARIEKAKQGLEEGKTFKEMVSEYSDDFATVGAGGDLDYAGRGIYDEAFENALFGLKDVGDVSSIVKTEYGYHIIKLTDIEGEEIVPFEELKTKLISQAKERLAREKLDEMVDELNRLSYETGDLDVISKTYDLPIETTDFFSRSGGKGIARNKAFTDTAFSDAVLNEKRNSEVVELADGQFAVLNLNEHQPPRDLDYNEVEKRIRTTLTNEKAAALTLEKAKSIVEKIKSGVSLADIGKELNISWNNNKDVTRQNSALPRNLVAKAFEMPKPTEELPSVAEITAANGDVSVVVLNDVIAGTLDLKEDEKLQAKASASEQQGSKEFELFVSWLKSEAEIETF